MRFCQDNRLLLQISSDWNDVDIPDASNGVKSNPQNNSHLPASLGGVGSLGLSSAGLNGQTANGHKWGGGGFIGDFWRYRIHGHLDIYQGRGKDH